MAKSDSTRTKPREVPFEGAGSSGDMRDRFRNVYKPNANPPKPKPKPKPQKKGK